MKAIALSQAADKGKAIASAKNNLAAVIAAVADKSIADQVTEAVKPHGFKNAAEWASVGESVGRVYAHLKLGTADGRAKKKLAKAIAKIERNDFLNEKQKQKLTQGDAQRRRGCAGTAAGGKCSGRQADGRRAGSHGEIAAHLG